ncbi:DUF1579 family protein, partial [Crocinitomix catalasitica]|nr:DUF1579 family protein [Crocinitomix catalasitica]
SDDEPMADLLNKKGLWKVEVKNGNNEAMGSASANIISGPGNHSVLLTFETNEGRFAGFELNEIISWNPESNQYDIVWVESFHSGIVIVSANPTENGYSYIREFEQNGQKTFERGSMIKIDENSFSMCSEVSDDQENWIITMTLLYKRVETKAY